MVKEVFVSESLSKNKKGHLEIGGCDCMDLVNEFQTPLYVLDEGLIRKNCKIYKNAMEKTYGENGLVIYASKAFLTMAMCKIINQEGLGMDVVSGGELYTANKAGFPMDKIYFHGNNKTYDEISLALDLNVRRIVVDNKQELHTINELAKEKGKIANISFRIKPGIDAHTHDFIMTGQIDSKFGVALENGEAKDIIIEASKLSNINVAGVHCHIGSQIFDLDPFELAAKVMLEFMADLKDNEGIIIKELNLGGGFGIKYTNADDPILYDKYIESVSKVVKNVCEEKGLETPFIVMEPGRSIVASSGITLYKVGCVKDIKDVRKYISVDGGMGDNPRYALYQSKYTAVVANDLNREENEVVTIAGKCCESGDLLLKDATLPDIKVGDIIAVLATGAYNYSMSSNYNRIPKPPVVLVNEGNANLIVKRETYEDIVRNDVIPEYLD